MIDLIHHALILFGGGTGIKFNVNIILSNITSLPTFVLDILHKCCKVRVNEVWMLDCLTVWSCRPPGRLHQYIHTF